MKKWNRFGIVLYLVMVLLIGTAKAQAQTGASGPPSAPPVTVSPPPAADPGSAADPQTPAVKPALPEEYVLRSTGAVHGKVSATQEIFIAIMDDLVSVRAAFNYDFTNSPTSSVSISVPAGYEVTDVRGEAIALSKVSEGALLVKFSRQLKSGYRLEVDLEKVRSKPAGVEKLPELVTAGLARESGYLAIQVAPGLEASSPEPSHLIALDPSELPDSLQEATEGPLLYAYRFARHPYSAKLNLIKYDQVTTLNATIDTANLVTVLTPEGRALTRAIYEVRNNRKQYLKIILPAAAEIWSVFVNEKPVIAATDGQGQFFIPLLTDNVPQNGSFKVELIYYLTVAKLEKRGELKALFPKTDLPISEMLVSLYLPPKYKYWDFEGTMERLDLELDTELTGLSDKPWQTRDDNAPAPPTGSEPTLSQAPAVQNSAFALERQKKMENEIADEVRRGYVVASAASGEPAKPDLDHGMVTSPSPALGGSPAGALPVKFSVPLRGALYRFTKLVVVNETPELSFHYKKTWTRLAWLRIFQTAKIAFWVLIVAVILSAIRWFWKRPRGKAQTAPVKSPKPGTEITPPPLPLEPLLEKATE